jgi:hypothetical protein
MERSCQEFIHILIRQGDPEDQEAGVRFQSTYPASTRRPANFRTAGIYPETIESLVVEDASRLTTNGFSRLGLRQTVFASSLAPDPQRVR